MLTVRQITKSIEKDTPLSWAEEWDNCGLIVGDADSQVARVLVALDIDLEILDEAVAHNCQLIIAHHPPLFSPVRKITAHDPQGRLLIRAIRQQLNLYAAHTNFDSAPFGLSTHLAKLIGLKNISALSRRKDSPYVKMVVFVPRPQLDAVFGALSAAGAGRIDNYDSCCFRVNGQGAFRPLSGASPCIGEIGKLEVVDEVRLEMILPESKLARAVQAMKQAHPYEAPAFDLYPLLNEEPGVGLGRIGMLEKPLSIAEIAGGLKSQLNIDWLKVTGAPGRVVEKIAVVSGSGASLIAEAAQQNAQLLITGDLKYHDYQKAAALNLSLIDIGHYHSEIIFIECVAAVLSNIWGDKLKIVKSDSNRLPYKYI